MYALPTISFEHSGQARGLDDGFSLSMQAQLLAGWRQLVDPITGRARADVAKIQNSVVLRLHKLHFGCTLALGAEQACRSDARRQAACAGTAAAVCRLTAASCCTINRSISLVL